MDLVIGFAIALAISGAAYFLKTLSHNGAITATIMGGLIFGLGGWEWAGLLVLFFVSSSLLSRWLSKRKEKLGQSFAKGSERDWAQVLANGGLPLLLVILHALQPDWDWVWWVYAGALAAVTADTWATEQGVLSKTSPRLVHSNQVVPRGSSGGVTTTGLFASILGAQLIGLFAGIWADTHFDLTTAILIAVAGFTGAIVDSIIGGTVQAVYHCPVCEKETEQHPTHRCGEATTLKRGWPWLNNDLVNLAASFTGALVVFLFIGG